MRRFATVLCMLLAVMITETANAAFPVKERNAQNGALAVTIPTPEAGSTTTVTTVSESAPAPQPSLSSMSQSDPGTLSFILGMGGILLLALGSITGIFIFPLAALVAAGFAIYFGAKGFKRKNMGFAIAGFVIGIFVAIASFGQFKHHD